ncbi:MAG: aspartate--tRNA ligase [Limnochordia bacterium]|jgi:aspartyl-tRNA synthetase
MAAEEKWMRTDGCGVLRLVDCGREVTLMGWVQRRRDHGGLIFIDMRDRSGVVQVVFNPDAGDAFTVAESLRNEYVVAVKGTVARRLEGMENPDLATGEIEVVAAELRVLNPSRTPPFPIYTGRPIKDVDETLRLRYRYLDMRRPEMQRNIILRHRAAKATRDFFDREGFIEVETPMLTRSTPEGARDFLVPSRVHPGEFFALPQSPQLFKQLCMVGGLERYFQLARCFRDEDLRADRQPEFTQIDVEMSFIDREDIIDTTERLMQAVFAETIGLEVARPFPRLSYEEAMARFGSDKPDMRFGLELVDVTDVFRDCQFKIFARTAASGGTIQGLNAPQAGSFTRRELDELVEVAGTFGAKGLVWLVFDSEGVRSPIAKFLSEAEIDALRERLQVQTGDLVLLVADERQAALEVLGQMRLFLGRKLDLIPQDQFSFLWVLDFPLFEWDEEEKRFVSVHHPFTSPLDEDLELVETNPAAAHSKSYDLVLNGYELGGGSIRIHRREIQEKVFKALGLTEEEVQDKFGFLLEAFEYGAPPHGGIALGFDRMVMLLAGQGSIRECIAFPKTQRATCPLTGAPGRVAARQLEELSIRVAALPPEAENGDAEG